MDRTNDGINNRHVGSLIKKLFMAFIGVAIAGMGVAFNLNATLGNDPVAVFFDGLRLALNLSTDQLGVATNIANACLLVVVFIFGKKYIHIGTFIYAIPIGVFIDIGTKLYQSIPLPRELWWQICSSILGCGMLFIGIAIFISVNIGLDPWTAAVMLLTDKTHRPFRMIKVIFDLILVLIGFLLGGTVGVTTIVTAFLGGPAIQKLSELISKFILPKLKINS